MKPALLLGVVAAALATSLALSAAYDARRPDAVTVDGRRLACGDLHTHEFLSFDARVHPLDFLYSVQRHNDDFVVVTDHNTALGGGLVRWWGGLLGFPVLVVTGEEVTTASWHVNALGIKTTVSRWLDINDTMDEIHRQGGIAMVNHPTRKYWSNVMPVFENGKADAVEWVNTAVVHEGKHNEVEQFIANLSARGLLNRTLKIGTSDSHFADALGEGATCFLVDNHTETALMEAMRERRGAVAWEGKFHAQEPWASKLNQNPEALAKIQFERPLAAQAAGLGFIAMMGAALLLRRV